MNVPFVSLNAQYKSIQPEIDKAIKNVIEESAFIGGKYVQEFEKKFGEMYGVKYVISCANGTDSLYIIMKMLGIGPGDEVITVANSWISSSETISQTGARPVFIDIDDRYYSMDETKLELAVTSKTKAVIVVHLHGQMCAMDVIQSICEAHNIPIIEDCAQAHFSSFKGVKAGVTGIASSFSFYPGKNLGAYGDAGCIITNNVELAQKCRMFANHGALKKHNHQIEGINSRMDGLQAAILSCKLSYIEKWTEKRIENANLYARYLSSISEVILPIIRPLSSHSFHLYVIRAKQRDELMKHLSTCNIETALHYPTILPDLPAYNYLKYSPEQFPIARSCQNEILSLPMYPELTEEMIQYIAESIATFYRN
jgi:dTDP-4-amino-4,6-dideoxygalactose transaminase